MSGPVLHRFSSSIFPSSISPAMQCPACGWHNPNPLTRCHHCGYSLPRERAGRPMRVALPAQADAATWQWCAAALIDLACALLLAMACLGALTGLYRVAPEPLGAVPLWGGIGIVAAGLVPPWLDACGIGSPGHRLLHLQLATQAGQRPGMLRSAWRGCCLLLTNLLLPGVLLALSHHCLAAPCMIGPQARACCAWPTSMPPHPAPAAPVRGGCCCPVSSCHRPCCCWHGATPC